MALRHYLPDFRPSLDAPMQVEKILPKMPKAATVEFRSGSDMKEVVAVIANSKLVHVNAAVGAGKSTELPYKVAEAMHIPVVQVFPNPYLASDVSDYCRSKGKESFFMETAMEDFPETGVVCVAASVLVARWLQAGEAALPRCIVFHDESHESDAYTYLVKNVCKSLKTVKTYVTATATSTGGGFRKMETAGKLIDHKVPVDVMRAEWDIYSNMPWGSEEIMGHALIFEENKSVATELSSQYRMAGLTVYRFHTRMPLEEFKMAMKQLRDPESNIVVIIAENAFRSGFTFPVSVIIDKAQVQNIIVENGKPIREIRDAYESELYQAKGRGARMGGLTTHYYCPQYEAKPFVCDLEAAELDAAALIFRLLGYVVPRELKGATTAEGDVPRDLLAAMRAFMPLACISAKQKIPLTDFYSVSGRRSPYLKQEFELNKRPADLLNHAISADTARKYGEGGVRSVVADMPQVIRQWEDQEYQSSVAREMESKRDLGYKRDSGYASPEYRDAVPEPLAVSGRREVDNQFDSPFDHAGRMRAVADTIQAFTAYEDVVDGMEVGHYYNATGLSSRSTHSAAFPEGHVSVCRWMSRDFSESRHLGLSDVERSVAINALLNRYNLRTCEMRVLTIAIPQAKERAVGKDLGAVRKWATEMSESLVESVADLRVLSRYVLRLVQGFCGLSEMSPLMDLEEKGRARVLRQIDSLPSAQIGPPSHMMEDLRNQWDSMSIGRASTLSDDSGDRGYREMERIPMPVTGKGMRAISGPTSEIRYDNKKRIEFSLRKEGRRLSLVKR